MRPHPRRAVRRRLVLSIRARDRESIRLHHDHRVHPQRVIALEPGPRTRPGRTCPLGTASTVNFAGIAGNQSFSIRPTTGVTGAGNAGLAG